MKFIIYDDKLEVCNQVAKVVNRAMMDNNCDYKIEKFVEYNDKLEQEINAVGYQKIYILDIQVPKVNGIDIASRIRKVDWDSIIIFVTAYDTYKDSVFTERLMILDYVSKKADYADRLYQCIKTALTSLNKNKVLSYTFNNIGYRIPVSDILYAVKVPLNKKTLIYTKSNIKYEIGINISTLLERLGPRFKQSHKSCIVNVENVTVVDRVNNMITFNNGKTIDMLSVRMSKDFNEYFMNYNS